MAKKDYANRITYHDVRGVRGGQGDSHGVPKESPPPPALAGDAEPLAGGDGEAARRGHGGGLEDVAPHLPWLGAVEVVVVIFWKAADCF